jgi:hypothetical protein
MRYDIFHIAYGICYLEDALFLPAVVMICSVEMSQNDHKGKDMATKRTTFGAGRFGEAA